MAEEDPFEGLELDEDFVRAAWHREGTAEERIERLRAIDAGHRRLEADRQAARVRPRRRSSKLAFAAMLGVPMLVAFVLYRGFVQEPQTITERAFGGEVFTFDGAPTRFPSPPADVSDVPLGTPAPPPVSPGPFAFIQSQPSTDEPVAWDPCRPIELVVNDRTAPTGADALLRAAAAEVSSITGLRIDITGTTNEVPTVDRSPVQVDRYGDRWAPVLVAWTDPEAIDEVAGDVIGVGGSQAVGRTNGRLVYVTGGLFLDGLQISEVLARPDGADQARAVITHELGHVIGLDHVDDETQLMAPVAGELTSFASGDRAGLSELGQGDCVPGL